jgi:hypothetical protein
MLAVRVNATATRHRGIFGFEVVEPTVLICVHSAVLCRLEVDRGGAVLRLNVRGCANTLLPVSRVGSLRPLTHHEAGGLKSSSSQSGVRVQFFVLCDEREVFVAVVALLRIVGLRYVAYSPCRHSRRSLKYGRCIGDRIAAPHSQDERRAKITHARNYLEGALICSKRWRHWWTKHCPIVVAVEC